MASDRGLKAPGPDLQERHGSREAPGARQRMLREAGDRGPLERGSGGSKEEGGKRKNEIFIPPPLSFLLFCILSCFSPPWSLLLLLLMMISAKSLRGNALKQRSVISDADVRAAASML